MSLKQKLIRILGGGLICAALIIPNPLVNAEDWNPDQAIAQYTQTIRREPNNAVAYNNRGIAYNRKGDTDRAIADLSQAIKIDPTYADAYNNRGTVYYARGEH